MNRKLRQKLLALVLLFILCLLGYQVYLIMVQGTSGRWIRASLQLKETLPEDFRQVGGDKSPRFHRINLARHYNNFDQDTKSAEKNEEGVLEDYKTIFMIRSLKDLLTSKDPDIQKLPAKVELDCSKSEREEISNDIVCVSKDEYLEELTFKQIKVEGITVLQLKEILIQIVTRKLQRLESGVKKWPGINDHESINEQPIFAGKVEIKKIDSKELLRKINDPPVDFNAVDDDDDVYSDEVEEEIIKSEHELSDSKEKLSDRNPKFKPKELQQKLSVPHIGKQSLNEGGNPGNQIHHHGNSGKGLSRAPSISAITNNHHIIIKKQDLERVVTPLPQSQDQKMPVSSPLEHEASHVNSVNRTFSQWEHFSKKINLLPPLVPPRLIPGKTLQPNAGSVAHQGYNSFIAQRNMRENPNIPPDQYSKYLAKEQIMRRPPFVYIPTTLKPMTIPVPTRKSRLTALLKMEAKLKQKMSPDLLRLMGYRLTVRKSLGERGFRESFGFNSPLLGGKIQHLNAVIMKMGDTQRMMARSSLHPSLIKRGEFQKRQTDLFCKNNIASNYMPGSIPELHTLLRHLLYDDEKRIVFCYVPKNGCSNVKRLMLILNGILPPNSSNDRRPPESVLSSVHNFRNLTREEAIYRLENYYKFAVIRNPLERMLSAYRNKLETPLNYTHRMKFPDRLKAFILGLYDRANLMNWTKTGNHSGDIHPSFLDFIKFMMKYPPYAYNEHFKRFLHLCFPCAIQYDTILNLKSLNYDIYALMEYLGIPVEYFPSSPSTISHKTEPTSTALSLYFQHVPLKYKRQLFHMLSQELQFYYSIYPEEAGIHKHL